MSNRVHPVKGPGLRPWVVYVDGEKLRSPKGRARHFKTEGAARKAGEVRAHIKKMVDDWKRAHGVKGLGDA